jgi:hypothetical protein
MKMYALTQLQVYRTNVIGRMPFSGARRSVALVRIDVSEVSIASVIRVKGISELGTT